MMMMMVMLTFTMMMMMVVVVVECLRRKGRVWLCFFPRARFFHEKTPSVLYI